MHKKNYQCTTVFPDEEVDSNKIIFRHLLKGTELPSNTSMVSEVIIEPGDVLNTRSRDSSIYYILSGRGEYIDEEGAAVLQRGDVTCCRSGESHQMHCTGGEPLIFLAVKISAA